MMNWKENTLYVAGRMMFKRVMGKASFCNIQDLTGKYPGICGKRSDRRRIICRISRNWISVISSVLKVKSFRTKTGEISIHAAEDDTSFQESYRSSGEVPRTDRYRYPLSSEICGSDHESGSQRYIYQTFQDPQGNP